MYMYKKSSSIMLYYFTKKMVPMMISGLVVEDVD